MSMPLNRSTRLFALHQVPLEGDIYDAVDYPKDSPVFLFFHAGGLVCGSRSVVPPWLVQICYLRKWPLICPGYRLLPQADGRALLDDSRAAFNFARSLGGDPNRKVIAGGASGGFFMAALIACHLTPKPAALLGITPIPTFKHPFFESSYLIPPSPIKEEEVEHILTEPVSVGTSPHPPGIFYLERLLPSGAKNPSFHEPPYPSQSGAGAGQDPHRSILYDFYIYQNAYGSMVSDVDPAFLDWTRANKDREGNDDPPAAAIPGEDRLAHWPFTVLLQGDSDVDVALAVCADVARCLGPGKARLCLAEGEGHLFEMTKFLEDEGRGMDAVRLAVAELDRAVLGIGGT